MDLSDIDPALRDAARRVPKLPILTGFGRAVTAAALRLAPGARVDGVERRIVREGAVNVRVYTPADASGAALLWMHGGGLVIGAAAMDDRFCGVTARETGVTIVSVDYRLPPRHPFPEPLDDCAAAFQWMRAHATELGVDPLRVAVGGQSAGGGLAAALVQRLHDQGVELAAQWLFCPMLDDRTAVDRRLDAAEHYVWDNRRNLVGWRAYLGDEVGAAVLPPYASAARRDDLRGLPPTWSYASDVELFYAEARAYADRLRAAGVQVHFETVPGAPHGFEAFATDSAPAQALLAGARGWLRARLEVASAS
ncbi:alpha/beta hydrolase [Microbacterium awajiense]|uniref:Alpha/beta hydrolase n=1 Tax=Microbacterium awajiense TaxID=415214 RepID=A0ABP7AX61_9MICO